MKNLLFIIIFAFGFLSTPVMADQKKFCQGFEEGYKTIKGKYVAVPACPAAPASPANSTDFREGIKAGMKAANR